MHPMSNTKDFWQMTRRERRGSIVVLVFIAVLLAATAAVRSCRTGEVTPVEHLQRFEQQIDSSSIDTEDHKSAPEKKRKAPAERRKPKSKPVKQKPKREPLPMEPVPQF